jgi:hypothetical protein
MYGTDDEDVVREFWPVLEIQNTSNPQQTRSYQNQAADDRFQIVLLSASTRLNHTFNDVSLSK